MIQRLDQLTQFITPKIVLWTGLIFVGFMMVVLPSEAIALANATTSDVSADTSLFYTARQLFDIAESYGVAGREYYILSRLRFDIAWPLAYGAFFTSAMAVVMKNGIYVLLPLLSVVFDLLENLFVSLVFAAYPDRLNIIATIAGPMTLLKWVLLMGSIGVILMGLIGKLQTKLKGRTR